LALFGTCLAALGGFGAMPSSHVYADLSAGFFRLHVSDGTHSHIHRVHTFFATIDNVTDPGSPTDLDSLINPEADVNCTARNFMAMWRSFVPSTYTISLLDFQPVVGGVPSGPIQSLQPYSFVGVGDAGGFPEAQTTYTFRDGEGAPVSFRAFGGGFYWNPGVKLALAANWATNINTQFAAYITGLVRSGAHAYPANLSKVCSHHGELIATPLAVVSGLNNRLRREYRVK
jgi:hypothetical protein